MSFLRRCLFRIYLMTLKTAHRNYLKSLTDSKKSQEDYFKKFIDIHRETEFGRRHRFDQIRSIHDYQNQVPVHTYADLQDQIEQVFQGAEQRLVATKVRVFEKTSGTTSRNKIIPFTEGFLREVHQATSAWIYQTFLLSPEMIGRRLYYSISPQMRDREFSPSGRPIGMEDDTEYLGFLGRLFVGLFMAVPQSVSKIRDPEQWKRQTLLHLLECRDLGFISLWSPTLLQVWIDFLRTADQDFCSRLSKNARQRLQKSQQEGLLLRLIWPNLEVVSFWTDGPSSLFVEDLRPSLHGVRIQSKGLMATEGIISIPMGGETGSPLAVQCQFLEFIDLETQKIKLAHELEIGKKYSPILSNSAGLYRYHLKDILECTGYHQKTPLIRFVSKLESVSDLCGEKLSADQVIAAIKAVQVDLGLDLKWTQLIASKTPTLGYVFVTEFDRDQVPKFEELLDEKLRENIHYDYARKLGQLARIKSMTFPLSYLQDQYQKFMISENVKLGDIKFQPLMSHDRFLMVLAKPSDAKASNICL